MTDDGAGRAEARAEAEEAGKRRIAREIHDDFGQRAAALALGMGTLRQRLPEAGGAGLDEEMGALHRRALALGEDLRRFSHELHPAQLDGRVLAEALQEHCEGVAERYGLELDLELNGEVGRLPAEIALALFRVVQEGLANVTRHAAARQVRLRLRVAAGGVTLHLRDDGRGFEADHREGRGLGLASIEERAAMFGGRCRVQSRPGAGTEIALWMPLPTPRPLQALFNLMRRYRGATFAVAAILLAIGGGIFATWRQARETREQELKAEVTLRFLEELFEGANPRRSFGQVLDARGLLRRGREKLSRELADQPQQRARLLEVLGGSETELGLYDEAREHLAELLELRRRPGEKELALATALARFGALEQSSGKGDPIPRFEQALALREKNLPPDDNEVLLSLNQLGTAFATVRRFDQAEIYLRRSLAGAERAWGPNDPRVATILHNLAGLATFRQDLGEAERLLERTLAIRRQALGPEDPTLLESLEALAVLRQHQQRYAEAEALLEGLLATTARIFGAEHPYCARLILNLAEARKSLGKREEGRRLLQEAQRIAEKSLAPDHYLRRRIDKALAEY